MSRFCDGAADYLNQQMQWDTLYEHDATQPPTYL